MDGLIITHSSTDACTKNALATMLTLNHVEMTAAAWRRQHRSRPREGGGSKGDMKVKVIIRLARRTESADSYLEGRMTYNRSHTKIKIKLNSHG